MEKSALGRESWGSEWDQGYWIGGGGAPECPVLLSGWHGVTGSVCLWAGKASIPAAATPEMLLEGAYTDSVAAACSSLWMLQVPAVIPRFREPWKPALRSYKPSQALFSLSIVPSPTCPTFYFCSHACFSIFPFCLQFLSFLFSPSLPFMPKFCPFSY